MIVVKEKAGRVRICPVCKKGYTEPPALSRKDNETLICPDCGTRESLADIGIDVEEQNRILEIIHKNMVTVREDCEEERSQR